MTKQQVKYLLLANNAETPRHMCQEGYDVEESPRRLLVRFVYTYEYGDIRAGFLRFLLYTFLNAMQEKILILF